MIINVMLQQTWLPGWHHKFADLFDLFVMLICDIKYHVKSQTFIYVISWQQAAWIKTEMIIYHPLTWTHWGWVPHICISKLTIIGLDNSLSAGWCQTIIWTSAGILLIWILGTNFSQILSKICTFSLKKMHLEMLSAKWIQICLSLNVLT